MKNETMPVSVVMVEDNLELCRGWTELFDLLGYQVTCYQRASEALADFHTLRKADIVFSDYYLPDVNGVEFLKTIREVLPRLPVVIITGSRESFIEDAIHGLPNTGILYKPLNIEDIEERIRSLVPRMNSASWGT